MLGLEPGLKLPSMVRVRARASARVRARASARVRARVRATIYG